MLIIPCSFSSCKKESWTSIWHIVPPTTLQLLISSTVPLLPMYHHRFCSRLIIGWEFLQQTLVGRKVHTSIIFLLQIFTLESISIKNACALSLALQVLLLALFFTTWSWHLWEPHPMHSQESKLCVYHLVVFIFLHNLASSSDAIASLSFIMWSTEEFLKWPPIRALTKATFLFHLSIVLL